MVPPQRDKLSALTIKHGMKPSTLRARTLLAGVAAVASLAVLPIAAIAARNVTTTLTTSVSSPTSTSTIPVAAHFGSGVNGFTASDVTVSNGTVSNFAGSG